MSSLSNACGHHISPWWLTTEESSKVSTDFSFNPSTSLTSLDLSGQDISDEDLILVANRCPTLRSLVLHTHDAKRSSGRSIADKGPLTDKGLIAIAEKCSSLQSLDVAACWSFTHLAFQAIAKNCPELRSLSVGGAFSWDTQNDKIAQSQIEDAIVAIAKNCPELRSLSIPGAVYSEDKLKTIISHCPKLEFFRIPNGNPFKSRDEILKTIGNHCKLLRVLDITGLGFSQEALLDVVTKCKDLQSIEVYLCYQIEPEWIENCKKINPKLKIELPRDPHWHKV
jgi:hypothetical protein